MLKPWHPPPAPVDIRTVMQARTRILFFAEAVTLAHMARPMALAQALDPERYEVHFACPVDQAHWLRGLNVRHWAIGSLSSDAFVRAIAHGTPPYSQDKLRQQVSEDTNIMDRVQPDLVIGDFRLSLLVSCPLNNIRHVNICNAYWSSYCQDSSYPLPDHPAIRYLGLPIMRWLFPLIAPFALARHARIYNRFRRAHGLSEIGNLRDIYVHGDQVLYADLPTLVPLNHPPANHHFIGPVLWTPPVAPPAWWDKVEGPGIYVTLGSSGDTSLLDRILDALSDLPYQVMVATVGRVMPRITATNIKVADYLPGIEASGRADLVICNGGSPTVYQALTQGKPVLGIPSNMDQFLNMRGVEATGCGRLMRTQQCSREAIRSAVQKLIHDPSYRHAAGRLQAEIRSYADQHVWRDLVRDWTSADPVSGKRPAG